MENFDLKIFKEKFIEDAHNLINELESDILELEKSPQNKELIDKIFRAMHTLKGVGSMYGFDEISRFTHLLENVYDAIRDERFGMTDTIFSITFSSVDHLRNLLANENISDKKLKTNHEHLIHQIEKLMKENSILIKKRTLLKEMAETPSFIDISKGLWYISLDFDDSLISRGIKLLKIFQELASVGEFYIDQNEIENKESHIQTIIIYLITDKSRADIEDVFLFLLDDTRIVQLSSNNILDDDFFSQNDKPNSTEQSILNVIHQLASGLEYELPQDKSESLKSETKEQNLIDDFIQVKQNISQRIPVSSEKLDQLMYLVTELVTLKTQMKLSCELNDLNALKLQVENIEKLSNGFRKNALSIRLVQIKELTLKFKRLVHDLCSQLQKHVDFVIDGDEIELDKSIVNLLADPLMHLIRNCIDHGIELPAERTKKNKPAKGIVKMTSYQTGNFIFIQISDDGNGIDIEKVKNKAIEKGIISTHDNLANHQIFDLIFLPGFSTAEHLTSVSGRGVGMDVVKKRIQEIRGEIQVDSETGLGTSFTIKLQQTLSIMDTLLVKTGKSYFMIPIDEVKNCEQEFHETIANKFNTQIAVGDKLLPFIYMRTVVRIKGESPLNEKIIVIQKQDKRYAIIVDDIIGEYQAVLKPLGYMFEDQHYYTGASILGDGSIAFMLDTGRLLAYSSMDN